MKGTKHRFFGYDYAPDKRMFHVIVRIKDTPGALNTVLEALRNHVNLIGSVSYSNPDGTATWSGFAEALSAADTEASLKKILLALGVVEDSVVESSDAGLLLDSYHTGIEVGAGEEYILLPAKGVSSTFDHLGQILGSGGETVLFDEGSSLGKLNANYFMKLLGRDQTRHQINRLSRLYRALGWGDIDIMIREHGARFDVTVSDCFECSARGGTRSSCSFARGYFTGFLSTIFGCELGGTETECRMRGDSACKFVLVQPIAGPAKTPAGRSRMT